MSSVDMYTWKKLTQHFQSTGALQSFHCRLFLHSSLPHSSQQGLRSELAFNEQFTSIFMAQVFKIIVSNKTYKYICLQMCIHTRLFASYIYRNAPFQEDQRTKSSKASWTTGVCGGEDFQSNRPQNTHNIHHLLCLINLPLMRCSQLHIANNNYKYFEIYKICIFAKIYTEL